MVMIMEKVDRKRGEDNPTPVMIPSFWRRRS
jgi:hypothetical protein